MYIYNSDTCYENTNKQICICYTVYSWNGTNHVVNHSIEYDIDE